VVMSSVYIILMLAQSLANVATRSGMSLLDLNSLHSHSYIHGQRWCFWFTVMISVVFNKSVTKMKNLTNEFIAAIACARMYV